MIIDQGNSATKLHIATGDKIVETTVTENEEMLEYVRQRIADDTFEAAIYSSVRREYDKRLINVMSRKIPHIVCMGNTTHLPIGIEYRTPHTLGHLQQARYGSRHPANGFINNSYNNRC